MNEEKLKQALIQAEQKMIAAEEVLSLITLDNIKEKILKILKKEAPTYDDIKKTISKLIITLYNTITKYVKSIKFDDEITIGYRGDLFKPKYHGVLLYDIICLLFDKYPNDLFKLSKFKINTKQSYFVYRITYKANKPKPCIYIVFDYSVKRNDTNRNYLYKFYTIEDLNEFIRDELITSSNSSSQTSSSSNSRSKTTSSSETGTSSGYQTNSRYGSNSSSSKSRSSKSSS